MFEPARNRLIIKYKKPYRRFIKAQYRLIKFFFNRGNIRKIANFIFLQFKVSLLFRIFNVFKILIKTRSLKEAYMAVFPEIDTRIPFIKTLPIALQIECTTRCNLRCIMCGHTYWKEEARDLSFEDFKKAIVQFPRLFKVWFLGFGENFVNPDFLKMLQYLKSKKIKACLLSNFTLVTKEVAEELVKLKVDIIYISIERTTGEAYEKVRVGASFEKVMQNINNVVELKKKLSTERPILNLYSAISNENLIGQARKFVSAYKWEKVLRSYLALYKKLIG